MKANILEAIFFDEHHNWDNFVEKYGRKDSASRQTGSKQV